MKTDRTNPQHLNDAEQDLCECTDRHCAACLGTCQERAVVTMYDTSKPEENQTGRRMCHDCADELHESSGAVWQCDFSRNPDEYDPFFDDMRK